MHSGTTHTGRRMRVGELAQAAGVSRETIHFYLREGLLPAGEKVNARVSYFDERHLTRLRVIKAFQQAHVPLARIREQLETLSKVALPETVDAHERAVAVVTEFLSLDGEEPPLTVAEVADRSGLTEEQIADLERLGVLQPQIGEGGPVYTGADADAATAARTIMDQGVEPEKLRFVLRYTKLAEEEIAFLVHHLIQPAVVAGRRDQVSATVANRGLRVIEAYLRRQHRRRTLLFSPELPELPDPLADTGEAIVEREEDRADDDER